jgi:HEPN domain-containing protein
MKNRELVEGWLKRARSNLERAKAGKTSKEILFEDLCFDCQQAVEKSLKALLIHLNKVFPKTHSIGRIVELIEETGTDVPEEIKDSVVLTEYAVSTRYPGDYEPVLEEEYKAALEMAKKFFIG